MGKGASKDASLSELQPAASLQSQTQSPTARKQNLPTAQARGRASTEPKRATNASTARSSAPEHLLKLHKRDGTFSMKVNEKTSVVAWDGEWVVPACFAHLGNDCCQDIASYLRPVVRLSLMEYDIKSYDGRYC